MFLILRHYNEVRHGFHSNDFWNHPHKQQLFPEIWARPRELLKQQPKLCARKGLDPYKTKQNNLWVSEKRVLNFKKERWPGIVSHSAATR